MQSRRQPTFLRYLRRVPLLAVVFLAALALVPGAWPDGRSDAGPPITAGFAPWYTKHGPAQAKPDASEIEILLLDHWQFTASSSGGGAPGGYKIRR